MQLKFSNWKLSIRNLEIDFRQLLINRWTMLIVFLWISGKFGMIQYTKYHSLNDLYYSCAVIALIYSAIISAYDSQQALNRRKMEQSNNLINMFDSSELRLVRDFTRALRNYQPYISENELQKMILNKNSASCILNVLIQEGYTAYKRTDINMERELVFLFNYWQNVYLNIKYNMCDKASVIHSLGHVYVAQYNRFKFWIDKNITKENSSGQYEDLLDFKQMIENESV